MLLYHAVLDGMLSACTVMGFQEQYEFLYHALLDGLQTGHLAYPLTGYPDTYKTLCVDDKKSKQLKKQFQVTLALQQCSLKLTCRQYPAIHTNYIISH